MQQDTSQKVALFYAWLDAKTAYLDNLTEHDAANYGRYDASKDILTRYKELFANEIALIIKQPPDNITSFKRKK